MSIFTKRSNFLFTESSVLCYVFFILFPITVNRLDWNKLRKSLTVHINFCFLCKYFWCTAVLEKLVFRWIAPLLALRKQSIFLNLHILLFSYIYIYIIQGDPRKMSVSVIELESAPEAGFYFFTCVLESEFWACVI